MIERPLWRERLAAAWKQAPIVWLTGPRRVGKTVLAKSIPNAEFFNCDLPSVAERLRDPESFYRSVRKQVVIFDDVHQLPDPSRLLKIGADAFPKLKILATGSSTLAATQKFRDSLAGRKRVVELVPVLHEELPAFGVADVRERLLRGGLPPALLAEARDSDLYSEWQDSYFARDVQELFRLEKRAGFLRVLELLLRQSGGMLDVTRIAAESQISRPTVMNWLEVYQVTHVAHLIRPFSAGGRREVIAQPKVFGFDTGMVCHARGWDHLRSEDCGALWEHLDPFSHFPVKASVAGGRLVTHTVGDQREGRVRALLDLAKPLQRAVVIAVAFQEDPLGDQPTIGINFACEVRDGPRLFRLAFPQIIAHPPFSVVGDADGGWIALARLIDQLRAFIFLIVEQGLVAEIIIIGWVQDGRLPHEFLILIGLVIDDVGQHLQSARGVRQLRVGKVLFQTGGQNLIFQLNGLGCTVEQAGDQRRVSRLVRSASGAQPDRLGQRRGQVAIDTRRPDRAIHVQFLLQAGVFLVQADLQFIHRRLGRGAGLFVGGDGKLLLLRQLAVPREIHLLRQVRHDGLDDELGFGLKWSVKVAGPSGAGIGREADRQRQRNQTGRQSVTEVLGHGTLSDNALIPALSFWRRAGRRRRRAAPLADCFGEYQALWPNRARAAH
jgi:hypothetical protein